MERSKLRLRHSFPDAHPSRRVNILLSAQQGSAGRRPGDIQSGEPGGRHDVIKCKVVSTAVEYEVDVDSLPRGRGGSPSRRNPDARGAVAFVDKNASSIRRLDRGLMWSGMQDDNWSFIRGSCFRGGCRSWGIRRRCKGGRGTRCSGGRRAGGEERHNAEDKTDAPHHDTHTMGASFPFYYWEKDPRSRHASEAPRQPYCTPCRQRVPTTVRECAFVSLRPLCPLLY